MIYRTHCGAAGTTTGLVGKRPALTVTFSMSFVIATLGLLLTLIFVTDLMFRVGRWNRRRHYDKDISSQLSTVQGATLGLLALIIGFTMSMAEARFDARRQINVREAAAVSTTYLRTSFLPEPEQSETRQLLVSYVAARRDFYRADPDERKQVAARTDALQRDIWQRVARVGVKHPDWDILSTYVTSVNEMFDLEAARTLANMVRLPSEILIVVIIIAIATVGITGFATGFGGGRTIISLYAVPALIAISCAVIVDLDRSWFGFISTGDLAMERVQHSIDLQQSAAR
jgi:ABC-type multidrug transport system fused ATPase/permease subunit